MTESDKCDEPYVIEFDDNKENVNTISNYFNTNKTNKASINNFAF